MITSRATVAIVAGVLAATVTSAGSITEIDWSDLAPNYDPQSNPYYGLDQRESMLLGMLVEVERAKIDGKELTAWQRQGEVLAAKALDSVGKNADDLLRRALGFGQEIETRSLSTSTHLAGTVVRVSGFVLPLDIEDQRITRFVLVPYAGACVHTPAPPANQLVTVDFKDGATVRGRFEAVTVTGTLEIQSLQHEVSYVDGASNLNTAYSLKADIVNRLQQGTPTSNF